MEDKETTYAQAVIQRRISQKVESEEAFQFYSDYGDEIGEWM